MHMVQDLLNELPELEDYVILTNNKTKIIKLFNNLITLINLYLEHQHF